MTAKRKGRIDVPRIPGWQDLIDGAQEETHLTMRDGRTVPRVRYGDEPGIGDVTGRPCYDCGASKGQYHVAPLCGLERCPSCGGQFSSCDCEFEGDEGPAEEPPPPSGTRAADERVAPTAAQKAAATRKRRAAAAKAARTRKRRAAGAKAAATRKRKAAAAKAARTRKRQAAGAKAAATRKRKAAGSKPG